MYRLLLEESYACRLMDDAGIQYTKVKEIPPSFQYALLATKDRITVAGRPKLAELQATHPFNAEMTEKFFKMDESAKNGIVYELEHLLAGLDIRHMIIVNDGRQFFGFSLSVLLEQDASVVDFLNGYNKVKEIRELVGTRATNLMHLPA